MRETKALIVVEDHVMEGGIGEAVRSVVANTRVPIYNMCVNQIPVSGTPEELLKFEEIDSTAIIKKVKSLII